LLHLPGLPETAESCGNRLPQEALQASFKAVSDQRVAGKGVMSMNESASSQAMPEHLKRLLRSREEIEEIVESIRLELYNQEKPCGANAIRERLDEEAVLPLPSASTIWRILRRRGLTHW
jgi:hypothetical protein